MIVVPTHVLNQLMIAVANATHGLTDTAGERHITSTIAAPQLRMAALSAIQDAIGETVWPGDRKITITHRKQTDDIFEET